MTRAAVDVLDGIVVVELSLDERFEVEAVVAFLRAGAHALEQMPVARTAVAEMVSRNHAVDIGLRVAQEIEDEARAVHERREAAYRAQAKGGKRR